MIRLKEGVEFAGIQPELLLGLMVAEGIWAEHGQVLWLTAIKDGDHGEQSFHNVGQASDLRIRYFDASEQRRVYNELKAALDKNFDVVLHSTHIHIEYQPRK